MKNVIMNLLGLVLLIGAVVGAYVVVKDRQIKKELSEVERSEFVDAGAVENAAMVDSKIELVRSGGVWSVTNTGEYTIDPATLKLDFTGYKPGGLHDGTFQNMTASVALDAAGQAVGAILKIDPKSVKTDAAALDTHLQADVFFDTANHPEVTAVIKSVTIEADGSVKAVTDLTIKSVTKTLAIPVKVEMTATGMKFSVDTKIKISEFGMAYGPVQDDVRVTASGELKRN